MSPGLAKPVPGGLDGVSPANFGYNSPVASLQTWVNGFAPPSSAPGGAGGDVKTESNGPTDPNSTPPGGVGETVYKTDTSSNVSPLSSTLSASVPYASHPYSAATTATTSSSYDQTAAATAAYYAAAGAAPGAYYHPSSALSSMDPYGYSATAQSATTGFAQKF